MTQSQTKSQTQEIDPEDVKNMSASPLKRYDHKEYTIAESAKYDMADREQAKEFSDVTYRQLKTLCDEDKITKERKDVCYQLGLFYHQLGQSTLLELYNPEKAFNIWNKTCQNLNGSSSCYQLSKHYIFNNVQATNFSTKKIELLYYFETMRRACLEQTLDDVGGVRPTDRKAKVDAGNACFDLFNNLKNYRNTGYYAFGKMYDEKDIEDMYNQVNPENILKPDLAKIKNMIDDTPISVMLQKSCDFEYKQACQLLFEAKIKGLYGLAKDAEAAIEHAKTACRLGLPKPCYNLYQIYYKGIFGPPDKDKAETYFKMWKGLSRSNHGPTDN